MCCHAMKEYIMLIVLKKLHWLCISTLKTKINTCIEYAKSMPDYADIIITTGSEKNIELIKKKAKELDSRKVDVVLAENRGRDVSALLVAAAPYIKNYDLVCFAHDKKTKQMKPYTVGKSFSYKCFENILARKGICRKYHRNL